MDRPIRVLFLADSHLGLDLPERPRVPRRRRGHDFLANHAAALARALDGSIDLVVHGGDVFDRPRISPGLAQQAYQPIRRVADAGIPVFIVPGNHERGRLPHAHLLAHPLIHVFDRPRTFTAEVRGLRIALAGFPYERRGVRARFLELLDQCAWREAEADVRLLCIHHCVEGATVGPADYTFTTAGDVIRGRDLPRDFALVLSGHIHRHQVLTRHLSGRPLASPVLYPGSIERTATAEIGERKGYLMLELGAATAHWHFHELPARPMLVRHLSAAGLNAAQLDAALRALIAETADDAVLYVRVEGALTPEHRQVLSAVRIRGYAPAGMNVEVQVADGYRPTFAPRRPKPVEREENLRLPL